MNLMTINQTTNTIIKKNMTQITLITIQGYLVEVDPGALEEVQEDHPISLVHSEEVAYRGGWKDQMVTHIILNQLGMDQVL